MVDAPSAATYIQALTPEALRSEGRSGYKMLEGARAARAYAYNVWRGRHHMRAPGEIRGARQPVNLTQQKGMSILPFVAFGLPVCDCTPLDASLSFDAKIRKAIADEDAERLRLDLLYRDAVIDCFLTGVSFVLVGLKFGGQRYTTGEKTIDVGQEFERLLDFDDIAVSPYAKDFDTARWIAHRYPVSRRDALRAVENGAYGALPEDYADGQLPNPHLATPEEAIEIINGLTTIEQRTNQYDTVAGQARTNEHSFGPSTDETIMLWDFVIQDDGDIWIVTMAGDPHSNDPFSAAGPDKFLAVWKWTGPAGGPITRLSFIPVPFSMMPLAVEQMQRDLAEVADLLTNKIVSQLLNTKLVTIYDSSAEDEAMQVKKAPGDAMIRGNPTAFGQVKHGGLLNEMLPGVEWINQKWQEQAGNPGLATGTTDTPMRTAAAFNGLMARVQSITEDLRRQVEAFATENLRKRMWFVENNPQLQRRVPITIGRDPYKLTIDAELTAKTKRGDHTSFVYKTRAYSMQYRDPSVVAQQQLAFITQALPSILQMQALFGVDAKGIVRSFAQRLDMEELENFIPDPLWAHEAEVMRQLGPQLANDPAGVGRQPNSTPAAGVKMPRNSSQQTQDLAAGGKPPPLMQGGM